MAKAKKCEVGYTCKFSCIAKNKDCTKELPPQVQKFLDKSPEALSGYVPEDILENKELIQSLKKLKDEEQQFVAEMVILIMGQERSKADKFAFSKDEILGMQSRASELNSAYEISYRSQKDQGITPESLRLKGGINDYLKKYRTQEVSDEEVETLWAILPSKYKKSLTVAGSLKKGSFWKGKSMDEDGLPDASGGNATQDRAKLLLKLYMRQGGRDIYTGQPLPLMEADLEHVIPFELGGKASENPANWGWTRTGINAGRGKRDIAEYIEKNVTKKLGLSSIEDPVDKIDPKNLKKIEKNYEKTQKQNKLKRQSKKDLESADWLNTPSTSWTKEQNEIFDRMVDSLTDPDLKKGYYLIEKIVPEFSSTALIHPIKRSSRRKVWLQELGGDYTKETLKLWKESDSAGKEKIQEFWGKAGELITQSIKSKNLYSEETSKEAMAEARRVVKQEFEKLIGAI